MSQPYYETPATRLYQADARALPLKTQSVHCVVTSPPYWGLRDYGIEPSVWGGHPECEHEWGDEELATEVGKGNWAQGTNGRGDLQPGGAEAKREPIRATSKVGFCWKCGAWRGALGLEPTPELYVEHMVEVFREVWRVLRPDGTLWLNLGDSYAASPGQRGSRGTRNDDPKYGGRDGRLDGSNRKNLPGLKPKDLVGIPWRVAFALQADGWWLRSDIIWSKPNPMPESVTDRPTKAHEYLFLLTKAERYYYDADAIQESQRSDHSSGNGFKRGARLSYLDENGPRGNDDQWIPSEAGRNKRTVWEIATQPYPEAHFATFPEKLIEPCILAGTSERGVCAECGVPWVRVVEKVETGKTHKMADGWDTGPGGHGTVHRNGREAGEAGKPVMESKTTSWRASCDHQADVIPATVLDPFAGSGTVSLVAQGLGRCGVGADLSEDYLALAQRRLEAVPIPMHVWRSA